MRMPLLQAATTIQAATATRISMQTLSAQHTSTATSNCSRLPTTLLTGKARVVKAGDGWVQVLATGNQV
jgi:hypothetical protein